MQETLRPGRREGFFSRYLRMLSRSRLRKEEAEKAERKQRVHGSTGIIRYAGGSRKGCGDENAVRAQNPAPLHLL
jgi:hypothetical protein